MGPLVGAQTIVLVLAFLVSGCATKSNDQPPEDGSADSSIPDATQTPTTSTSRRPSDQEQAAAAWSKLWTSGMAATPEGRAEANTVATPEMVERVAALTLGRTRSVVSHPATSQRDDGTYWIQDCVIVEPPTFNTVNVWYDGGATKNQQGVWQITEVHLHLPAPCVPAAMAKDAIAAYEGYWDFGKSWWDPVDPTNPLVTKYTTGTRREDELRDLQKFQSRNVVLRGRPTTHPEVTQVRSATELAIVDCQVADPGFGLFDRTTGARLEEIAKAEPGRRDRKSAIMRFEDGQWKIADLGYREGVQCEFAPTPQGQPVV